MERVRLTYPKGSSMQCERAFWIVRYDFAPHIVDGEETSLDLFPDNENGIEKLFSDEKFLALVKKEGIDVQIT